MGGRGRGNMLNKNNKKQMQQMKGNKNWGRGRGRGGGAEQAGEGMKQVKNKDGLNCNSGAFPICLSSIACILSPHLLFKKHWRRRSEGKDFGSSPMQFEKVMRREDERNLEKTN